ncbi:hypothetical protein [Streptomyces sp. NBC_01718]|uniref:hypothetical protein n=1 Tax=unclassified Streptomyces TaxID=2593676 RepID=UPI0030E479CE
MLTGKRAISAAVLTLAGLGLVLTSAPSDRVSTYVKIGFTTGALSATGPVVGGLLVEASWRWLFPINISVAVVALIFAARLMPDTRHDRTVRFPDMAGGLILIVAIGAPALGLVEAPGWGWSGDPAQLPPHGHASTV